MHTDATNSWEAYKTQLLQKAAPVLRALGYTLDDEQPHTKGERHVIQAVGSGRKLVLLGRAAHGTRVVIKIADEPAGMRELEHEQTCHTVIERIHFAYGAFLTPPVRFSGRRNGLALSVTEFIEQDVPFLERTLPEQFSIALAAFKAQESAHATTAAHRAWAARTFGEIDAAHYCANARTYTHAIASSNPVFERATAFLCEHQETLDRYGSFLTHWDFIPQNFRIRDGKVYLLDQSSLRFGNKYEGWARFVNFMELYNPPLARALVQYVADNRTPEESLSLQLMRVYRFTELVYHHALLLPKTDGALHELSAARVAFWTAVLEHVLENTLVPQSLVDAYKGKRDALRSADEKRRQEGLH